MMKSLMTTMLGITMSLSPSLVYGHGADLDQHRSLVRIQLKADKSVEKTVAVMGLDVAGIDLHARTMDVVVNDADLAALRANSGLHLIETYTAATMAAPDADYHTSEEVHAIMAKFAADYPNLTMMKSIGKTHEGKDIWALKISDNPNETEADEPSILFNAMHHAREVMTTEVALDTIEYLLVKYEVDFQVADWVNNTEIWVVPMLNVDGNNKVWKSDSMWRKNTREGYGVDINRNYPHAWNKCNGSSGSRNSDTYRGPSAGSEPEAQALMGLVAEVKPVFNISYHSYSELVIYPYGCNGEHAGNRQIVEGVGKAIANVLPSDSNPNRRYTPGTSWEILYAVDGGDIDWMHAEHQVLPYVIELNASTQGFQPRYSTWRDKTVEKARAAWQLLLTRVQESGIRGQIEDATGGSITVTSANQKSLNPVSVTHKLKADGSFHIILEPGMYNVVVTAPGKNFEPRAVTVGATRVDLAF